MEVKVKLYKREGTYFSQKDQKDKPFTNFYVSINDNMIPVEVKYFPNPQFDNRDPGYSSRVAVLSTFAELLPEKEKKEESPVTPVTPSAAPAADQNSEDTLPF